MQKASPETIPEFGLEI